MWRAPATKFANAALPAMRVVGMAYIGLGGIAALGLLASVAIVPAAPVLEQVAEPARHAVANLIVQPPTEVLVPFHFIEPKPQPAAVQFVSSVTLDVTIDEAAPVAGVHAEDEPIENAAPVGPTQVPVLVQVTPVSKPWVTEDIQVDAAPADDTQEADVVVPSDVVEPAPEAELVMASVEAPRALPTPAPTLTPQELKAQTDTANQAAIDAVKAEKVRAKAEADAANQAAIGAVKVAQTTSAPAMADAALTLPAPTAAQKRADAKTAAEQAKIAAAKARAEADAGNQAAIDAARAAKAAKH